MRKAVPFPRAAKWALILSGGLLLAFILVTGWSQDPIKDISKELGVDLSGGEIVTNSDTHGGFHGDGVSLIILKFSDGELLDRIKESGQWKPLPLDETTGILIYGKEDGYSRIGPFVSGTDGKPLLPDIQDGFYFFRDRHPEARQGEAGILERFSFNFTFAMYDAVDHTLYYCKFDT